MRMPEVRYCLLGAALALFGATAAPFSIASDGAAIRLDSLESVFWKVADNHYEVGDPLSSSTAFSVFEEVYPSLLNLESATLNRSDIALAEIVEALRLLHFYAQSAESAALLVQSVKKLSEECNETSSRDSDCNKLSAHFQEAYDALLDTQQFQLAKDFASASVSVQRLNIQSPENFEATSAAVFGLGASSNPVEVLPEPVLLETDGLKVFSAVSTTCGPSLAALEWLSNRSEELNSLVISTRYLSSPRDFRENVPRLVEFNQASESIDISVAVGRSGWPETIWFDQTPIFFLVRDGEVIDKLVGWPSDDQGDLLLETARRLISSEG